MILGYAGRIILLTFAPALIICFILFQSRTCSRLNRRFFLKLVIWGAISLIPATVLVYLISRYLKGSIPGWEYFYPFAGVALIEETAKLIVVLLIIYRNESLDSINDGIGYSIAVAIGFSLAENVLYLTGSAGSLSLIIARGITAVPLHSLCGAYMGYYVASAKKKEAGFHPFSLLIPVILHGLYNTLLQTSGYWPYLIFPLLIVSALILLRIKE